MDLSPLLSPRTVAIVGASETGHYATSLHHNLVNAGFPIDCLFPVNPKRSQLFDLRCYPSVREIPDPIDLAVIVVPQPLVIPVAKECGEKRVRAISVISNGFAEIGKEGRKLQEELTAVARSFDLLLHGPNTLGHVCPRSKTLLWSSILPEKFKLGGLGAIFHSSGMLNLIFLTAAQRGVGFSFGLAPGNEAGLNLGDYLAWGVEDADTRVIALVIESIRDPQRFLRALERAAELQKPIVALRLGRSARARRSIVSHTGSLASAGEAWDGLFEQKGVVGVHNLDELMEASALLMSADPRRLGSRQVGLITISGGDCSLLSDICERVGLELPDLAGVNRALVAKELKKDSFIGNPLDIEDLLQSNPDGFARAVEAFAGFAAFEAIGCRLNIPERATGRLLQSYRRVAEIVRRAGKQVFFFSRASEQIAQEWFDFFSSLEAPFLIEYEKGLKALQKSAGLGEKWRRCAAGRAERPEKPPTKVREILSRAGKNQLSTRDTLAFLAECGIPLVRTEIAASPDEALACADAIGYPVALKVCSADIPHRSDIGAVRTGLRNREEVKSAYAEILSCCRKAKPEASIEGVAVQPMVQGVAEVILGISRDAQLGPVVLLGVGGIFVEVLRDVVLRVPPLSLEECREMIGALRGKALLEGARGRPRGDLEALAKTIFSVSRLALELREEISELDLNPVMVLPEGQGVAAVDALVILRSS